MKRVAEDGMTEIFWDCLFDREPKMQMKEADILRCIAVVTEEAYALEQFYKKEFTPADVKRKVREYFLAQEQRGAHMETMERSIQELLKSMDEKLDAIQKEGSLAEHVDLEEIYLLKVQTAEKQKLTLLEEIKELQMENASLRHLLFQKEQLLEGTYLKWYLNQKTKRIQKRWKKYAIRILQDMRFSPEQLEILLRAVTEGMPLCDLKKLNDPDMEPEHMKKTLELLLYMKTEKRRRSRNGNE